MEIIDKPCRSRHPEPIKGCRLCWLAQNDERYQKLWTRPQHPPEVERILEVIKESQRVPLTTIDCTYYGDALSGFEKQSRQIPPSRDWHWCNHPERPKGDTVCKCLGCGPRCSGYIATSEEE